MPDLYQNHASGLDSPANYAAVVTPNDNTDLTNVARAIYVGTSGNVNLTTAGGNTVLISNIVAGTVLPIRTKRVLSTNTTANAVIIALW